VSKLFFVKYSGLGNDFILFEKRAFLQSIEENSRSLPQWVSSLCHRRRSIGADGVVLYEKIDSDRYKLDFFNDDGSFAALCGNGLRCAAHYISTQNNNLPTLSIETAHFLHQCQVNGEIVTCTMQTPTYHASYVSRSKEHLDDHHDWHLLECGVPHLMKILEVPSDIRAVALEEIGPTFQRKAGLPFETVNVSLLQLIDVQQQTPKVLIRTYERGVFKETEACGTAAMSGAALLTKIYPFKSNWAFHFSGFTQEVSEGESIEVDLGEQCKMRAKVEFIFEGYLP
jgi:diaminopimelate epimerase